MTGERELFVGKWRWYGTTVMEWFDVGNPIFHNYTPQNQGYEYYCTISTDGIYRGYRNDTLIHDLILSKVDFEIFNGVNTSGMNINLNCLDNLIELNHLSLNLTKDTISIGQYPLNFKDDENHLESLRNFFVKE